MIAQCIGELFLGIAAWIAEALFGVPRGKAARGGEFVGGLRVRSGDQPGLGVEWLVGIWRVESGRLSMDGVVVPVVETIAGSRRPATLHEAVAGADIIIVTVRTETAMLEWSMLRRFDGRALRALDVPASSGVSSGGRTDR